MKINKLAGFASLSIAAVLAAASLSITSCSAKKEAGYGSSSGNFAAMSMEDADIAYDDAEFSMAMPDEKAFRSTGTGYNPEGPAGVEGQNPPAPAPEPAQESQKSSSAYERKLIRTGSVRLEVESLADVKDKVQTWVKSYGGYIASSDEGSNNVNFTVKIPSARFEDAMGETSSFGKVTGKNINSKDVTERYYDLKSRLETKRVMQERLETYLKSAKDVKDMLEIESKLNDVTADIESMQGQINRLNSQIDFSEITINARLRPNYTEKGFTLPDVGRRFSDLASDIVYFFVGFLFVLLYIAIFGIPILLVIALIFWLGWGKVGLVRKLFHKLKKQD